MIMGGGGFPFVPVGDAQIRLKLRGRAWALAADQRHIPRQHRLLAYCKQNSISLAYSK
jgi:hypothetical protein